LTINNIEVVYDGVILVLKGVSLNARAGEITTLLGANGAGKTTTLKAISGLLMAERGQVTKGPVELDGARLDRLPPHEVVRRGAPTQGTSQCSAACRQRLRQGSGRSGRRSFSRWSSTLRTDASPGLFQAGSSPLELRKAYGQNFFHCHSAVGELLG
jgi:ABC-type dipeptide/oligopeptide/nickel transport system ATPase component